MNMNGYIEAPYRYEARRYLVRGENPNGPIRLLGDLVWSEDMPSAGFSRDRESAAISEACELSRRMRQSLLLGHRMDRSGAGFVAEYMVVASGDSIPHVVTLQAQDRLNLRHEPYQCAPVQS